MGNSSITAKHHIFLTYCHEIVGIAMKWLVQQHFPYSAIGEARNFQQALAALPQQEYDLVVLDAELSDSNHLLGALQHIRSVSPRTKILIFSELDEAVYGPKYRAFGSNGFLPKKADIDRIVTTIRSALSGEAETGANPRLLARNLTGREAEITEMLVRGIPLAEIGRQMGLKETTISTYKKRIFQKFGVHTLSDLIAVWKIHHA